MTTLSERIDQLLVLRNINQAKLAQIGGIKRSAITNIKSGRNKGFSASTALLICKELKINPFWLILGEGTPELEPQAKDDGEKAKAIISNMTVSKRQFAMKLLTELDDSII